MLKLCTALCAGALIVQGAAAANVGVDRSDAPWLAFMNVYELPENGGGFVFGSPWGIPDLVANFDDGASTLTMSPNTIGDPNEFWYQDPTGTGNPNPGGPGAPGNKVMQANLYQEVTGGFAGQTITFSGTVLSTSLTDAHVARVFIRDFAADYSSSVDTVMDIDASGSFSISLATIDDAARHVQWGLQVEGVNVWVTDVDPFGNIVFQTVPGPATLALLGAVCPIATRRRRA